MVRAASLGVGASPESIFFPEMSEAGLFAAKHGGEHALEALFG